jgi:hypothetical protein
MPSRRYGALASTGALLLTLTLVAMVWNPSVEQRAEVQPRASWAPTALSPTATLAQTFVPERGGLCGIEVLAARYQPDNPLPEDYGVCLRLAPVDDPDAPLTEHCQQVVQLTHNAPLLISFPELYQVADRPLRATFWAEPPADVTLWATAEESYASGALAVGGDVSAGDLKMTLVYRYRVTDALEDLVRLAGEWLWPLLCLAVLLLGPGLLLGLTLAGRRALARAVPLGLAAWPLVLLWLSAIGLPFRGTEIWLVTAACGVGAILILARQEPLRWRLLAGLQRRETWLLVAIALLSLAMRLLNVRALVTPNWVDALHHAEITQLIVARGGLPVDGEPYVQLWGFYYHFGFHAIAAALAQMASIPAHRAVLILGQALLALAPVACYALTRELAGRRLPALGAALVIGCWSYMPAYYASWGRYPQMAGLLLLPGAMVAIWRVATAPDTGWRDRVLAAILVAGLLLTHYRVSALLLPWIVLALLRLLWRPRRAALFAAVWAAAIALILAAPWLWRLLGQFAAQFTDQYGSLAAGPGEVDAWPTVLLTHRWTPYLLGGAVVGLAWAAVRRCWPVVRFGLWAGLCTLIPNLHWLGLPDVWLVNNTTVAISFWLPAGVLTGYLLGDLARLAGAHLQRLHRGASRRGHTRGLLGAAMVLALALWGSWLHLDVVNASTVIVQPEDVVAAEWVRAELPPDAVVLINSTHWSNSARRGSDGGWWLPLLANRQVTLPSLLYIQGHRRRALEINAFASAVEQAPDYCDAGFVTTLREAGVTHVYVGAKGGPLTPARLESCLAYVTLYRQGPVRVYALTSGDLGSR